MHLDVVKRRVLYYAGDAGRYSEEALKQVEIAGSLGFRRIEVLESPGNRRLHLVWGFGVMNPNKFGNPMCPPCKLPETRIWQSDGSR